MADPKALFQALLPGTLAKHYSVTAAGRRRLREETPRWNRLAAAIALALRATPQEV